MTLLRPAILSLALLAMVAASGPASAGGAYGYRGYGYGGYGGARVGVGVYIGGPVWGGWYGRPYYPGYPGYGYGYGYPYPYASPYYGAPYPYYPYAGPTVPASPPVYIEQSEPQPVQSAPQQAPQQSNYWYYCPDSRAYYPYVKDCPAGWQRVTPQPPS